MAYDRKLAYKRKLAYEAVDTKNYMNGNVHVISLAYEKNLAHERSRRKIPLLISVIV